LTACFRRSSMMLRAATFALLLASVTSATTESPATKAWELPLYCLSSQQELNFENGNGQFKNEGFTMTGNTRVSSKTSFNLLGGFIEFDVDGTLIQPGVITTFYTTSPAEENCGLECYCDGFHDERRCLEMDIMETNGNCAMASTYHTHYTPGVTGNRDCDQWGCSSKLLLNATRFHIRADFAENGNMTVLVNGRPNDYYFPIPSEAAHAVVVQTMNEVGAVFVSSQWYGWAPEADSCPKGSKDLLPNSTISISNIKVMGTVKQGPEPCRCSSLAQCAASRTTSSTSTANTTLLDGIGTASQSGSPSFLPVGLPSDASAFRCHLLLEVLALVLVQFCIL